MPIALGKRYDIASPITYQEVKVNSDGSLALGSSSTSGKTVVAGTGAEENTWQGGATITNVTTDTALKTAAGAGVRNYLTDLVLSNANAAAVAVEIRDGSTTVGVGMTIPASGTLVINFSTAIRGSANTALNVRTPVAATSAVTVLGTGYTGA